MNRCGCLSRPYGQDIQQRSDALTPAALFTMTETQINLLKRDIQLFVNNRVIIFLSTATIGHVNT